MEKFNRLSFRLLSLFVLIFPVLSFSQNLEIINRDNSNVILEKSAFGYSAIIPSSGTGFVPDNNNFKNPVTNRDNINLLNWVLKFTAPGKVFKDVSFANPATGYIVTELGAVYKSTNGGDNWTNVMNLGFPYYWYGVCALTPDTVVIAGFNNQGNIHSGVVRWSVNGGSTWSGDIVLTVPTNGVGWLTRVHFFDQNRGVVSNEFSGGIYYTTNGGRDSSTWHYVIVNSDLGWFAGNLDADANGTIFTTGIHFAESTNYGLNWTSGSPADGTFDGGVDFIDNNLMKGLTGGGSISPSVTGWVHRTTDGGSTWSARLNTFSYPIRSVKYFSDTLMLAFGGNVNSEVGGIYSSNNSGSTWNLEVNTSAEMFSYDYKVISPDSMDIWSVGSTGGSTGFTGKLYKARVANVIGIVGVKTNRSQIPDSYKLFQNYPNPFNPSTTIRYQIPKSGQTNITIYDILGNKVAVPVNEAQNAGTYQVEWNASNLSSGIYFYKLTSGFYSETKKMLLVK